MERRLRRHAAAIFRAALAAADPEEAVRRHLRLEGETLVAGRTRYPLRDCRRVLIIGAGKASAAMARAVERVLGRRIDDGLVNVKYGHLAKLRRVELNECGHPVPDENGIQGAEHIFQLAAGAGANDLLICVISGGGSALMPLPASGISLDEKQATTKLLLACGANIHEINAVRKHISRIKGGQLARAAAPARVISLLLSDVIGDDLDVIGSGPTAPDASTFADALAILTKYGIAERAPRPVLDRLTAGAHGEIEDTPKRLENAQNLVVGSNLLAVAAAERQAKALGYRTMVLSTFIEGETRDVARMHAAILKEVAQNGRPLRRPCCIVTGGETTVTLRGGGMGGRNQEFVLAAAMDLAGLPGVCVLSAGTDGSDGPTDAAGAIADGRSIARAEALGVKAQDFLARNDSYRFFEPLGDLLITGPTNTNVMDVRLLLAAKTKGQER
jgi:hydroxypyruvate reductase